MKSNIHFEIKCMVTLRSYLTRVGPQSPLRVEPAAQWTTRGATSGLARSAVNTTQTFSLLAAFLCYHGRSSGTRIDFHGSLSILLSVGHVSSLAYVLHDLNWGSGDFVQTAS